VNYDALDSGNYSIKSIVMDLLLQDTLDIPAEYCDGTATVPFDI